MSPLTSLAILALLAGSGTLSIAQDACTQCPNLSPANPLAELAAGNGRFVTGNLKPRQDACRRACTKDSQKPYAIVLSCVDSRVPPEIAFDQRIGDLFVVRVAGNVASDEAIGSIEYAIEHLKTPKVIMVLGHEDCGAVKAALTLQPAPDLLPSFLNRIYPAILGLGTKGIQASSLDQAIEQNVRYNAKLLPVYSPTIHEAVVKEHIPIQGAYYSVTSGVVRLVNP